MTKISALTALAGGSVDTANDLLAIVDTSATQTKKITVADLLSLVTDITGLLDFKGSTDCSANPNYPAASKGDFYLVSVAGKIGGASGIVVESGDTYFATADNAGGTQAGVGTSWTVIQGNVAYVPVNKAGDTMTGDLVVPAEAYGVGWDGSNEVPTKNDVYDKIETVIAGSGSVSDAAYGVGWNGDTTNAPSKNAVYDKIETITGGTVSAWKEPVRVATTAAGTLASSFENGDTVDGVTLATNDRILIKDQATASENGIYTVNASGAPTRATDADAGSELVGATVFVSEGTNNKDTIWSCTNDATPTLDSTSLTFGRRSNGWTIFTASPSGASSSDFINLGGFNEALVIARLSASVSGVRRVVASTDNGGSYDSTASNYLTVSDLGVEANAATPALGYHGTNATASRTLIVHVKNLKGALKASTANNAIASINILYVGANDINALRVDSHNGGTITGTIELRCR